MKTRILALALMMALLLGCLGGTALAEDPYVVTMVNIGNTYEDQDKVVAAINEILRRDLNMELELINLSFGTFIEQYRLMLSGGEKMDLMLSFAAMAAPYVASQALVDLSDLIDEYGVNIKADLGDDAKIANINGYVYGIPTKCDWYRETSLMVRKDWLAESGFAAADIKTIEDIEALFEAVKANHPEAAMLAMGKGQRSDSDWRTVDPLSDYYGVLENYGADATVVNYFATDAYKDFVSRQYAWAQKGWISADAAITTDTGDAQIGAGLAFAQISTNTPAMVVEASLNIGVEVEIIPILEAYTTSTYTNQFYWAVPQNAKDKAKAFQCLDYIYGSQEVTDLLTWGIEGEHYVRTDDGHVKFPEGVDFQNTKYNANYAFRLPNQFIASIWEGMPIDVWERTQEKNEAASRSIALGFAYDGIAFANEIAAIGNVTAEYLDALNTGAVNPEEVLPRFLSDLENAGLQRIIDAKQEQLDAWMAAQ